MLVLPCGGDVVFTIAPASVSPTPASHKPTPVMPEGDITSGCAFWRRCRDAQSSGSSRATRQSRNRLDLDTRFNRQRRDRGNGVARCNACDGYRRPKSSWRRRRSRAVSRSPFDLQAATQDPATTGTTAPSLRQRRDPLNRKYRTLQRQYGTLNRLPRDLQRHSRYLNRKCATVIAPYATHQTATATHSPPPET